MSTYKGTGNTEYLLYDGHGSTRQLTDSSGAVATDQVFNYDGYGVLLGYTGTPQTNLLYSGEYFDSDLLQYNLRARYYDPLNGRFNQADPFAGNNQDPQSLHKYLYCHANPVNGLDPSGEFGIIGFSLQALNVMGIVSTIIGFALKAVSIGMGFKQLGELTDFMIELNRAPIPDLITKLNIRNLVGLLAINTIGKIFGAGADIVQSVLVLLAFSVLLRATLGFLRSMDEAYALAKAARSSGPITDPSRILPSPKFNKHHIFPQDPKFTKYWDKAQIKVNEYTLEIERTTHLKGVHGKGLLELPGRWNNRWSKFFTDNPGATAKQIYQQAGIMMDEFGLSDLPIVPY